MKSPYPQSSGFRWQPRRLRAYAFLAAFLASASSVHAIGLIDVPLDHWSYEMLDRFEVRAGLDRTILETLPLMRSDVAELVHRLITGAESETWSPSEVEWQQLRMLQAEFSEELTDQGYPVPVLQRAYHQWRPANTRFQMFYVARHTSEHAIQDRSGDLPQLDVSLLLQPAAAVQLFDHFAGFGQLNYRVRTGDGLLRQTRTTTDGATEFVFDPKDRFSITRTFDPYVRYGRGPVLVDFGRERLRWGPGRHNAMLLVDERPPIDQLRLRFDFGPVWFTSVFGQVRPQQFATDDPTLDFNEKYIAAHRLVIQAHRRLVLGISDVVVYGNRGIDLSYLNPLAIYFVTQSNNGDSDNALTGVDAKLLLPNLELYGELILDDLNLRKGISHFGNKPAVLMGLLWMQPFGARDWDFDAEWSWASQYTYSHVTPINRWEHYGRTLGGRSGTDAALFVAGLRHRWSRGWSTRLAYELELLGEGDVSIGHDQRTSDEQEFLSGVAERLHRPGLEVHYRGLRNLVLDWRGSWEIVENPLHDSARSNLESLRLHFATRIEF